MGAQQLRKYWGHSPSHNKFDINLRASGIG